MIMKVPIANSVSAIAVLVTGLYLWLGRRRIPIEKRVEELRSGGLVEAAE